MPKLLDLHEAIRAETVARPDATLAELRRWLGETHQVYASVGLMHATLARLDLTYKKSPSVRANKTAQTLLQRVPTGVRISPD